MNNEPLYQGEKIKDLIPQREPMMMIDSYYGGNENEGVAGLTIKDNNTFCENGMLHEPGIVEHVAQTAAAFNGYNNRISAQNGGEPHIGYIGDVKNCIINRLPNVGETIITHITLITRVLNVGLMTAETKVNDEVIATCQIKLFEKTD